jgi:BarA-like signal transduction histidine kinase
MLTALSASTAKKNVRKQWDKIIPAKGITAALAMTSFLSYGLPCGKAIDADI